MTARSQKHISDGVLFKKKDPQSEKCNHIFSLVFLWSTVSAQQTVEISSVSESEDGMYLSIVRLPVIQIPTFVHRVHSKVSIIMWKVFHIPCKYLEVWR